MYLSDITYDYWSNMVSTVLLNCSSMTKGPYEKCNLEKQEARW